MDDTPVLLPRYFGTGTIAKSAGILHRDIKVPSNGPMYTSGHPRRSAVPFPTRRRYDNSAKQYTASVEMCEGIHRHPWLFETTAP